MPLPEGKTQAGALRVATAHRRRIWADSGYRNEDQRIRHLESICTQMFGGDETAGKALAVDAIWN